MKNRIVNFIATFGFVGKIPFAPGTFGSIVAVLLWCAFNVNLANNSFIFLASFWFFVTLICCYLSIKSSDLHQKISGKKDHKEIVIDEVCGQFIALLIPALIFKNFLDYKIIFWSLVFFRIFDIFKPWIIGVADKKLKGGLGVTVDDILAGVFAGLIVSILYLCYLAF